MSLPLVMIATAMVGLVLGGLAAWPTIHRLHTQLADATWQLRHDPLTGLLNRAGFADAYTDVRHTDQPAVVMLVDLDGFKAVNDRYGHEIGDGVLVLVADRLTEAAALYGGVAARLAGDEFAVLLPIRATGVDRVADAIVTIITTPGVITTDSGTAIQVQPAVSVGVTITEPTDPLRDAIRRADIAMYHAKYDGGGQHSAYETGMAMPTTRHRHGRRLRDLHRDRHTSRRRPGGR